MSLTELQKNRLMNSMKDIRMAPGWLFIRQVCTAEAANEPPDWDGLRKELFDEFGKLFEEEFYAAIQRQRGSKERPKYPGAR